MLFDHTCSMLCFYGTNRFEQIGHEKGIKGVVTSCTSPLTIGGLIFKSLTYLLA